MDQLSTVPEKYRDIVEQHTPKGWRIVWFEPQRKTGQFMYGNIGWIRGCADFFNRVIATCPIETRSDLAVYLHECGHVNLGHEHDCWVHEYAQAEYEAEKYAIDAMRAHGISVPRTYLMGAAAYVDYCIRNRPDVTHTDEVLKFAYGRDWKKHI